MSGRQVGEFVHQRPMIRSVRNSMDKATVISIYPKAVTDSNHTIQPGTFSIAAGSYKNPSIAVLGPSSWWRDVDPDQPLLEIPVSATQVAHSFIADYVTGMLGCNMGDAMPGLFFVDGELTVEDVKSKYMFQLAAAKSKQDNWFRILVGLADSLWARGGGNPLVIWDEMRMAARELGLENKLWLKDFLAAEMIRCFACGNLRNPEFPICSNCKNVDMTHPRAAEIKLATL